MKKKYGPYLVHSTHCQWRNHSEEVQVDVKDMKNKSPWLGPRHVTEDYLKLNIKIQVINTYVMFLVIFLLSMICGHYAAMLSSLKSSASTSKQKYFFWIFVPRILLRGYSLNGNFPLVTAIIEENSFCSYIITLQWTVKEIMIYDFADCLFQLQTSSPLAKTQAIMSHLSECQTSNSESKRERASKQAK